MRLYPNKQMAYGKRKYSAPMSFGDSYKRPKARTYTQKPYGRSTVSRGWGGPKGTSAEQKFIDRGVATVQLNSTGSITLLNGCVPGSTATTRVGTKSVLTSIQFHGQAFTDSTTTAVNFALYIVWDKNPNAATPAITDYLVEVNPASFPNLNNRARFVTLWKHKGSVIGTAAAPTSEGSVVIPDMFKKTALTTIYNTGTAGTVGDIQQGALFLIAISDTSSGTADAQLQFNTRVRFLD